MGSNWGTSGIELRSRNIPQLALQGTYGSLAFSIRGHSEEGTWPLGPGDVGIRAGLVVHTDIRPLNDSDEWHDGYLIQSSVSMGRGGTPVCLHHLRPLSTSQVSDGAGGAATRHVFRNGWQSWSGSGSFKQTEIDRDPPLRFLRLLATNPENPSPGSGGQFTSEMFTVIRSENGRGAILAGFVDTAEHFSHVFTSFERGRCRMDCQIELDDRTLEPGRSTRMPALLVIFGQNENELLEAYASMLGHRMNARVPEKHYTGWCSWYYYYTRVSESDILANLEHMDAQRECFPVDVFQVDDGYQPAMGDWLETNPKFPNGMPYIAERIRERGLIPGIWTAPFLVSSASRVYREHPEWLLRDMNNRPLQACWNPNWNPRTQYALDPTHPGVQEHLRHVFQTITRVWGFEYVKIDFLYAAALRSRYHNPRFTRAGALRLGLEAIREGCGNDAFILACGCPLGPAIGLVDGMRIGADVAPYWSNWVSRRLGGGRHMVSSENAVRNTLTRAFMHRRLWLNDPDCVMLRNEGTKLTEEEIRTLASVVSVSGGMTLVSDDLSQLGPERAALFPKLVEIVKDQPAGPAAPGETPQAVDLMMNGFPEIFLRRGLKNIYLALVNPQAAPRSMALDLNRLSLGRDRLPAAVGEFWTGEQVPVRGSTLEVTVPPHGCRLFVLEK